MHLHSTLAGRAGTFRVRGAAWQLDALRYRGFLYLIPTRGDGNGAYQVVEATGHDVWSLLDALSEQITQVSGMAVQRLDARIAKAPTPRRTPVRTRKLERVA